MFRFNRLVTFSLALVMTLVVVDASTAREDGAMVTRSIASVAARA